MFAFVCVGVGVCDYVCVCVRLVYYYIATLMYSYIIQ